MAKKKDSVVRGTDLWGALNGKKAELKEVVDIKMGDVVGQVTVVFREADKIQEIEEIYQEKMPDKPTVELKGLGKIEIPNDNEKFDTHPKAKEWYNKVKPINREKVFRIAYEFISDEEKPSEDAQEGTEILMDRLRMMDAVEIMQKGMKISGFGTQLDEAKND